MESRIDYSGMLYEATEEPRKGDIFVVLDIVKRRYRLYDIDRGQVFFCLREDIDQALRDNTIKILEDKRIPE